AGHPDLAADAGEAVQRWRFEPARQAGQAVDAWIVLPVRFVLG
ncbi:MAG: TonB family protein, partial [Candidatus Rokubacteria bacterium]|nr:TonB family protein [Candidatus Rokubacteria bacterium]